MQIEELRSLIVDGNIPRARFLLCSNGASWKVPEAQAIIDREQFGDRAVFEHVNHDTLVRILQSTTPVSVVVAVASGVWSGRGVAFALRAAPVKVCTSGRANPAARR